jgi:hypothetical protein
LSGSNEKTVTPALRANSLYQFERNIFGDFYFNAPNPEHTTDEEELLSRKETKVHIP